MWNGQKATKKMEGQDLFEGLTEKPYLQMFLFKYVWLIGQSEQVCIHIDVLFQFWKSVFSIDIQIKIYTRWTGNYYLWILQILKVVKCTDIFVLLMIRIQSLAFNLIWTNYSNFFHPVRKTKRKRRTEKSWERKKGKERGRGFWTSTTCTRDKFSILTRIYTDSKGES